MPSFITYELKGFDEATARLAKIIPQLKTANRDMARRAGQILTRALKEEAPVGTHYRITDDSVVVERPATLKKSIIFRTYVKSDEVVQLKFYAAKHVVYVVNPTRPHPIVAKNVNFLRFFWPNAPPEIVERFGGNIVFFKQVNHPGTKANPFHVRAYKSVETELEELMMQYGATVIEAMMGQQGRFLF